MPNKELTLEEIIQVVIDRNPLTAPRFINILALPQKERGERLIELRNILKTTREEVIAEIHLYLEREREGWVKMEDVEIDTQKALALVIDFVNNNMFKIKGELVLGLSNTDSYRLVRVIADANPIRVRGR